jgi:hypothetical protein
LLAHAGPVQEARFRESELAGWVGPIRRFNLMALRNAARVARRKPSPEKVDWGYLQAESSNFLRALHFVCTAIDFRRGGVTCAPDGTLTCFKTAIDL